MSSVVPKSCGVHDGSFHADEVVACTLLVYFGLVDKDKIVRTRDPLLLANCEYICDIGDIYNPDEKKFDHHQSSYLGLLSSAGMVLKYLYDKKLCSKLDYEYLKRHLIAGIDAIDNGRLHLPYGVCSFSQIIGYYVPPYSSVEADYTAGFFKAFDWSLFIFKSIMAKIACTRKFEPFVKKAMDRLENCLFFDREMPWKDSFFLLGGQDHLAQFIIMPTGNHWKLQGIPPSLDRLMEVRVKLPAKWAGLSGTQFATISGIDGAIFCHKGRFMSIWQTKKDAINALQIVLNKR